MLTHSYANSLQDSGARREDVDGRKTSWVHPGRRLGPDPYKGRELGTLVARAVQKEHLAFCKSHGRFFPFISAVPPCRTLVVLHHSP